MLKRNWPFILAAAIVLSIAGYFYYLYTISPTLNWSPNYNHTSSSPYGNELLYNVMRDLCPEKKFTTIEEPLIYHPYFNKAEATNNIYFFSGNSFSPDRSTIASLRDFINKGNQIFIAANQVSTFFLDSILTEQLNDSILENGLSFTECMSFTPSLIHPQLQVKKNPVIRFKVFQASLPFSTGYVPDIFFNTNYWRSDYYKIGYFRADKKENYTNYIKIRVGLGWLHLYTTPLVFTNYYLRKKEVFDYAQKVFIHLEPGDVYWHVNTYGSMGDNEEGIAVSGQNPFGVLLSFASFRYAWYSFIGAIILFCIFGFKRRQRAIPVLEKNTNTSVEFAETIAKLYLADGRHKNIANQKFRYFFNFVRTKYGINLKANLPDDKKRLSYLSKVPIEHLDKIVFNHAKMVSLPNTTLEELNESVYLINGFYRSSG